MATLYEMMENVNLTCPSGGDFYVCDTAWTQFTGCCTVNPCKFGYGDCPKHHMRPLSFDAHDFKYLSFDHLSCLSSDREMRIYSCANLQPPFLGCCRDVACAEEYGCLDEQFGAAVLGSKEAWPMVARSDPAVSSEQRGLWMAESSGRRGLLGFAPTLGIWLSILLIAVSSLIFLAWKKWSVCGEALNNTFLPLTSSFLGIHLHPRRLSASPCTIRKSTSNRPQQYLVVHRKGMAEWPSRPSRFLPTQQRSFFLRLGLCIERMLHGLRCGYGTFC